MSDSKTEFQKWWNSEEEPINFPKRAAEKGWQAATEQQQSVIDQQLRTITALNNALGGEGSLTTDNLVRVGRLETEIDELRTKLAQLELALKVRNEALTEIASMTQDTDLLWWQVKAREALAIQPSQEALDEYVMSRLELCYVHENTPLYRIKDKS